MLTTAGAARATASAKLGKLELIELIELIELLGLEGAAMALCRERVVPNSPGFHQTSKNAPANPTITALNKKLRMCRSWRKLEFAPDPFKGASLQSVYNALPIFFGKHCGHRGLRNE